MCYIIPHRCRPGRSVLASSPASQQLRAVRVKNEAVLWHAARRPLPARHWAARAGLARRPARCPHVRRGGCVCVAWRGCLRVGDSDAGGGPRATERDWGARSLVRCAPGAPGETARGATPHSGAARGACIRRVAVSLRLRAAREKGRVAHACQSARDASSTCRKRACTPRLVTRFLVLRARSPRSHACATTAI